MRYRFRMVNYVDGSENRIEGFRTEEQATRYADQVIAAMDSSDARETLFTIEEME